MYKKEISLPVQFGRYHVGIFEQFRLDIGSDETDGEHATKLRPESMTVAKYQRRLDHLSFVDRIQSFARGADTVEWYSIDEDRFPSKLTMT